MSRVSCQFRVVTGGVLNKLADKNLVRKAFQTNAMPPVPVITLA